MYFLIHIYTLYITGRIYTCPSGKTKVIQHKFFRWKCIVHIPGRIEDIITHIMTFFYSIKIDPREVIIYRLYIYRNMDFSRSGNNFKIPWCTRLRTLSRSEPRFAADTSCSRVYYRQAKKDRRFRVVERGSTHIMYLYYTERGWWYTEAWRVDDVRERSDV